MTAETAFSNRDFADLDDASIADAIKKATVPKSEGPRPLYRELPPAAPFPVDALGETLSKAARAIEGMIQCPIACAANSVLAVASLAAQGRANVTLPIGQGKPAPLSLYMLTVLESGERKSSADSMALKPVRDTEREIAEMGKADRQSFAVKMSAHDANARHLTNKLKADRAALEAALRDLGPPPQPPLLALLVASSDPTMEGIFRVYQQGSPSVAMLCDDAATFIGGHSLRAETRAATTASLCRAWDGSKLERIRGGDGVTLLSDRRLAVHFMIQPGVAAGFLSDSQFADQGLLARFLISAPEGRAGTRIRDDTAYQVSACNAAFDLEDYNTAIAGLLRQPVRWKDENDRALGVELDALEFTTEARALFVEFANAIEGELGPKGSLPMAKAFASKLPEHAARIAGTLTLIANPSANQIEAATLADAISLAEYYLGEAVRLIASGAVDPELRAAQTLLDWLHALPGETIGLRDIYRLGPNTIRQADKARRAMGILVEHGWATPMPYGAEIEGQHHKEAWEIVRC